MTTRAKVIAITVVFGIAALATGPALWPPSPMIHMPTPTQLPFYILLSIIECLLFGLGIAFLIFGLPLVRRSQVIPPRNALAMYLALAWMLVSWWPHDNLHMHIGLDTHGLLFIEYGFHLTLILATLILTTNFTQLLKKPRI